MTVAEACKRLGISRSLLYREMAAGKLKYHLTPVRGRPPTRTIYRDDLEDYMAALPAGLSPPCVPR